MGGLKCGILSADGKPTPYSHIFSFSFYEEKVFYSFPPRP